VSAHTNTGAPRWTTDARIALVWGALAAVSVVAVLPYLLQTIPGAAERVPVPLPVLAALQAMQAFVLLGLLSFAGLRMGHRVGLGSPLLQALVARRKPAWPRLRPYQAVVLGVLAASAIVAASLVLDPLLPRPLHPLADPGAGRSALNGLLASFYGGIAEELQLRLFLMTLVAWLLARFGRRQLPPAAYWVAILFAAVLFGMGHLPAAAALWGLDGIVVARTLLLNGLAGIVFGWLYWKRGIEMAMLAHFSADIVLHVLAPLAGNATP
jgi:hypothetical protein